MKRCCGLHPARGLITTDVDYIDRYTEYALSEPEKTS
jgi:hypothetical protein